LAASYEQQVEAKAEQFGHTLHQLSGFHQRDPFRGVSPSLRKALEGMGFALESCLAIGVVVSGIDMVPSKRCG
jgi:hypothetical protein